MLDYGFSAYRAITLDSEAISTPAVRVTGGTANTVEAVIEGCITALMPVTETKLVTETELAETVEAPIEKGDRLGCIILKNARGETVGEIPLAAASSVSRSAFSDRFLAVIAQWLHINNGSAFQAEPHEAIVSQQIVRIYLDPPEAFHVIWIRKAPQRGHGFGGTLRPCKLYYDRITIQVVTLPYRGEAVGNEEQLLFGFIALQ